MRDDTQESGLSQTDIDALRVGGVDCQAGLILYPYDGTAFPVGLLPPTFMFAKPVQASYLKLQYRDTSINYETAAAASDPGELKIATEAWLELTRRAGRTALQATISVKIDGVIQTCRYELKIAQGYLRGALYYDTYDHPEQPGFGTVMRMQLGQGEPKVFLSTPATAIAGPCTSCHSIASRGGSMSAATQDYTAFRQTQQASTYTLTQDVQPQPRTIQRDATFAALTPSGDAMLTMGNPDCTSGADAFPRSPNNFPFVLGPAQATLRRTTDGSVIPTTGLLQDHYMWMPQFSPLGDQVVFNDAKPGSAGTDRRDLAVMKFDDATKTFSDLRVLVSKQGPEPSLDYAPYATLSLGPLDSGCAQMGPTATGAIAHGSCTGPCYPAWPFFTPDGKGVVYALVSEPDFTIAIPGRSTPAQSELWYVDVETGDRVRLDNANKGLQTAEQNFYPSVLPVSVGGYYWIFWTSTRAWGHRALTSPTPSTNFYGDPIKPIPKRIWVSALRPRPSNETGPLPLVDLSSRPFYLEGQTSTGNLRPVATPNPCVSGSGACTSGTECCSGFCSIDEATERGKCVPEKACAELNEKCNGDGDCCASPIGEAEHICVGGYCAPRLP